jgi:hypothetical protein
MRVRLEAFRRDYGVRLEESLKIGLNLDCDRVGSGEWRPHRQRSCVIQSPVPPGVEVRQRSSSAY